MGGLGYIRPRSSDRISIGLSRSIPSSDHRTFPRFRFRRSGRADLARAIPHRFDPIPADISSPPPSGPPTNTMPSEDRRQLQQRQQQQAPTAAAHGKVHYRSSISHSALRPRERGSLSLSRSPSLRLLSSQTLHSRAPVRLHRVVRCARVKDGERRREGTRVANECRTVNRAG